MAITRARERKAVFLRSFDIAYIQVNLKIKEKVDAMIKFRSYSFKKIYLDEPIFTDEENELKIGYLNINGLLNGNHAEYLNMDKNLLNLEFLVLAETKLHHTINNEVIMNKLTNWKLINRFDATDNRKHMGMLLLASKNTITDIKSIMHHSESNAGCLQIQGILIELKCKLSFGFIYCRTTPSTSDLKKIKDVYEDCNPLLGDLNISHRIEQHQAKLEKLCGSSKESILRDITRSISNNQLDYVIIDVVMKKQCYASCFYNFISDHKAITLRIGLEDNSISDKILEKIYFNKESHLKVMSQINDQSPPDGRRISNFEDSEADFEYQNVITYNTEKDSSCKKFNRKFLNTDGSTCWLNSCLQLILNGFDRIEDVSEFTSDLGVKLLHLRDSQTSTLNPNDIKNLLVSVEDTRIATELSELDSFGPDHC